MTCGNLNVKHFIIQSGKASHKGKVRLINEDAALILERQLFIAGNYTFSGLYAVADGMGGHENGEVASGIALETLSQNIVKFFIRPGLSSEAHSFANKPLQIFGNAVNAANIEVYKEAQKKNLNMGTTLTAMLIIDSKACIANVGDSRLYLLRDGLLNQLTEDHSLVAEMVTAGKISQQDIYTHPHRNIITRCLGMQPEIEADFFSKDLKPGDCFIICSDGIWEMVRDEKINEILVKSPTPQIACRRLIKEANNNGGADNITAVVVKVSG